MYLMKLTVKGFKDVEINGSENDRNTILYNKLFILISIRDRENEKWGELSLKNIADKLNCDVADTIWVIAHAIQRELITIVTNNIEEEHNSIILNVNEIQKMLLYNDLRVIDRAKKLLTF